MSVIYTTGLLLILSVAILALGVAGYLLYSENKELLHKVKNEIFLDKKVEVRANDTKPILDPQISEEIPVILNSVKPKVESSETIMVEGMSDRFTDYSTEDIYKSIAAYHKLSVTMANSALLLKKNRNKPHPVNIQVVRNINQKVVKPKLPELYELTLDLKDSHVYTSRPS